MAIMKILAKKPTNIALIVIGAGLAIWGYQKSGGFGSQLSSAFTGSHSDSVMMLYIGGAVCMILGIYFYFKK
jgi:hypothetical protein